MARKRGVAVLLGIWIVVVVMAVVMVVVEGGAPEDVLL
jgi:hypothetical protein